MAYFIADFISYCIISFYVVKMFLNFIFGLKNRHFIHVNAIYTSTRMKIKD